MSAMAFREPNEAKWGGTRPAHKGTQVAKSEGATNETKIIHTVTASKTFFLCDWTCDTWGTATGWVRLFVRDAADVEQYQIIKLRADVATGDMAVAGTPKEPIEIPAGYDICLLSNAASRSGEAFIHGWEE